MKDTYYIDGITRVIDPFWKIKCLKCGHDGWSVIIISKCSSCKSNNITCTNPGHKEQEKDPPS